MPRNDSDWTEFWNKEDETEADMLERFYEESKYGLDSPWDMSVNDIDPEDPYFEARFWDFILTVHGPDEYAKMRYFDEEGFEV